MTQWTDILIAEAREYAERGFSMKHTASLMRVSYSALNGQATINHIRFKRPVHGALPDPVRAALLTEALDHRTDAALSARAALQREIAVAKAEASRAPIYRGGWPER